MEGAYKKYIIATSFIIAAAIFAGGILLGVFLDRYRVSDVINSIQESELDTESYTVEQMFAENFGGTNCDFLRSRLTDMSAKLSGIGHKLTLYESGTLPLQRSDYDYLKRRYFVLESHIYIYELRMKNACNDDRMLVLFFYRGGDDTESVKQGYALDELYRNYPGRVSTHSFDIDFKNSTMTDLLEKYYNITGAPTIVINNNMTKRGFVSVGELKAMMRQGG